MSRIRLPVALLLLAVVPFTLRAADEKPALDLSGHRSEVFTVAFSPDGKRLASGSNKEVIVWDLSAGKELFTYRITGTNVYGLAFTPDGKRLAVGISTAVRFLDATSGKEAADVVKAAHFLFRMAYSPDGKHLAASSGSLQNAGELCVWDLATGQAVTRLPPPAGGVVLNVAYSADGRRLVTGSGAASGVRAGEVTVWDVAGGREVVTLRGHAENVYGVAFSPDGRRVASAGGARGSSRAGEVKLWDPLTGQEALSLTGHTGPVFTVAYSPDGRLLATASGDRTVRLWDAASGREVRSLAGHTGVVYSAAFSPDGKRLASAGADRAVKVWDVPAPGRAAEPLDEKQARACWDDLRGDDARKAYRAVGLLAGAPKEAVPLLRARVRPAAPLIGEAQKSLERWLRELDDEDFEVRERAGAELARLGEAALPAARKALAGKPSAEVRRRLEEIVGRLGGRTPSPDLRAALRAVEVLEHAGTPEARHLLKELAAGLPEAALTREADAALGRLGKRNSSPEK